MPKSTSIIASKYTIQTFLLTVLHSTKISKINYMNKIIIILTITSACSTVSVTVTF